MSGFWFFARFFIGWGIFTYFLYLTDAPEMFGFGAIIGLVCAILGMEDSPLRGGMRRLIQKAWKIIPPSIVLLQ